MNIDWSKAPEGATHYGPDCASFEACWYKVDADGEVLCMLAENDDKFEPVTSLPDNAVGRPKIWQGAGLPPVGVEIEMKHKSATAEWANPDFTKRTLAWVGNRRFVVQGDETIGDLDDYLFRPIHTQEQIEAEEREREIDEMCACIFTHYGNPKGSEHYLGLATKLHSEGYRKQPKEDA